MGQCIYLAEDHRGDRDAGTWPIMLDEGIEVTIPRKGRRNIEVDGERFHWAVGRKLRYREGSNDADLHLTVVVQHADGQGARLEAGFDGEFSLCVPAKGFADDQTLASTPAVVRAVIERALALGWRPRERGPAMRLQNQERFHPEASRPLVGDRGYDAAKLDEYLAGATLVGSKG
jgi:hypothetical protein